MTRRSVWADVEARGIRDGDCFVWTGCKNKKGYGSVRFQGTTWVVHRLAWTELRGPIPEGHDVDHTCFNRGCFNVDHLEPVPHEENVRRATVNRTHCKNGHEFTPDNIDPGTMRRQGARRCLTCYTEWKAS